MKGAQSTLYLASLEGYGLEVPRLVLVVRSFERQARPPVYLVHVSPHCTYHEAQFDYLYLAPRHQGFGFDQLPNPVHVHIALPKSRAQIAPDNKELPDDLVSIAWGELYPTLEAALLAVGEQ